MERVYENLYQWAGTGVTGKKQSWVPRLQSVVNFFRGHVSSFMKIRTSFEVLLRKFMQENTTDKY